MKKKISLVMAYYENPQMLEYQIDIWRSLPEEMKGLINLVMVDDGSRDHPAKLPSDIGFPVQLYRIKVDVRWNQDAARNIGVHHAPSDWVMLTDMDHVVPADTWEALQQGNYNGYAAYTFRRLRAPAMEEYKPHPNSWFMAKAHFCKVWYDERFAGFYGTDGDFKDRLRLAGPIIALKGQLITFPREVIPDASTTRYVRKEHYDFETVKRIRRERGTAPPKRMSFPYERVM